MKKLNQNSNIFYLDDSNLRSPLKKFRISSVCKNCFYNNDQIEELKNFAKQFNLTDYSGIHNIKKKKKIFAKSGLLLKRFSLIPEKNDNQLIFNARRKIKVKTDSSFKISQDKINE